MNRFIAGLLTVVVLLPLGAQAGEEVILFRSTEDAAHPPDPSVCAGAPFTANVLLGATLWSTIQRPFTGKVKHDHVFPVGTATACLELTNVLFPQGLDQKFYVRFDLHDGAYIANGTCKVISNQTPQPFIILAGCSLQLVSGPSGVVGGSVVSSSVFNPLHRPGFNTGSYWTLLVYR